MGSNCAEPQDTVQTLMRSALRIADRVYVLEHGRVGREGSSAELAADDYIRQAYLGVA